MPHPLEGIIYLDKSGHKSVVYSWMTMSLSPPLLPLEAAVYLAIEVVVVMVVD
jgi:hypothetical protein